MIFITLGSQKFQFDRLLKAIDNLCEKGVINASEVFAQSGYSNYVPRYYKYKSFLDRDEFSERMSNADIVITHGGTGVPRLKKYGEHVDDHQLQLIKQFDGMNLICPCWEVENLDVALKEAVSTRYNSYISNTETVIKSIRSFIDSI